MDLLLEEFAAFVAVLPRLPLPLAAELEAVCIGTYLTLAWLAGLACAKSGATVSREMVQSDTLHTTYSRVGSYGRNRPKTGA